MVLCWGPRVRGSCTDRGRNGTGVLSSFLTAPAKRWRIWSPPVISPSFLYTSWQRADQQHSEPFSRNSFRWPHCLFFFLKDLLDYQALVSRWKKVYGRSKQQEVLRCLYLYVKPQFVLCGLLYHAAAYITFSLQPSFPLLHTEAYLPKAAMCWYAFTNRATQLNFQRAIKRTADREETLAALTRQTSCMCTESAGYRLLCDMCFSLPARSSSLTFPPPNFPCPPPKGLQGPILLEEKGQGNIDKRKHVMLSVSFSCLDEHWHLALTFFSFFYLCSYFFNCFLLHCDLCAQLCKLHRKKKEHYFYQ